MNALIKALVTGLLALPLAAPAEKGITEQEHLFQPADEARARAEAAEAGLLSPIAYAAGVNAMDRARRGYQGGATIEAVTGLLDQARASFDQATKSAGQARLTFKEPLAQREAARNAEAFRLAGSRWVQAEEELRAAALRLEKGDVSGARKRGGESNRLYGEAELDAVKAALFTEARGLVLSLEPARTARFAPKTTSHAQALLQQAEAELKADRTRTATAKRLAANAGAEARHALALAEFLSKAREQDITSEDLVLQWEASLARTGAAAGSPPDLSSGPNSATDALAKSVKELRERAEQQATALQQRDQQIDALEDEIHELDTQLTGAASEASSLNLRLEAEERARQQNERLNKLFSAAEATVLRQGGDIIVRIEGLKFSPGSARLTPAASALMDKVRQATEIFPAAMIAVEGHTDATGDSAANQRLSQARADAVRSYMVERQQLPAGRITAIGYGDSRPIANNATADGRRQNRRIDLVITPR